MGQPESRASRARLDTVAVHCHCLRPLQLPLPLPPETESATATAIAPVADDPVDLHRLMLSGWAGGNSKFEIDVDLPWNAYRQYE